MKGKTSIYIANLKTFFVHIQNHGKTSDPCKQLCQKAKDLIFMARVITRLLRAELTNAPLGYYALFKV